MRTYQGVFLGAFRNPEERLQIKVMDDFFRQVSGGLSRAIGAGQSPAANPVPSPVTSPGSPLPGAPTPAEGDLLYGLASGAWARLSIGSAAQFLTVAGGIPAWSTLSASSLPAHASTHKSGGSDAIKLDELAAATDVTTLNASTSAHGLLRKLDGLTTTFLRGDGSWATPPPGLDGTADETITGNWLFSGGNTTRLGIPGAGDVIKIGVAGETAYSGSGLLLDDDSGFFGEISVPDALLTANRCWSYPDATGVVVLSPIPTSVMANCTNISTGFSFRDSSSTNKRLRIILSGVAATTNSALSFSSTAGRTYTFGDDDLTVVGTVGTPISLTGQTASIAGTTVRTTTHAGLYRLSGYIVVTAVTTPGTIAIIGTWTDPQATHTDVDISSNINGGFTFSPTAAGDYTWGQITVRATSGSAIKLGTNKTAGTFTYSFYGTVEAL